MLDLDALCARTTDVRLGGQTLRVRVPSVALVERLLALADCPDDGLLVRQTRLAADVLANNADGVPVTAESLAALPPGALAAILQAAVAAAMEAGGDPNSASPR